MYCSHRPDFSLFCYWGCDGFEVGLATNARHFNAGRTKHTTLDKDCRLFATEALRESPTRSCGRCSGRLPERAFPAKGSPSEPRFDICCELILLLLHCYYCFHLLLILLRLLQRRRTRPLLLLLLLLLLCFYRPCDDYASELRRQRLHCCCPSSSAVERLPLDTSKCAAPGGVPGGCEGRAGG